MHTEHLVDSKQQYMMRPTNYRTFNNFWCDYYSLPIVLYMIAFQATFQFLRLFPAQVPWLPFPSFLPGSRYKNPKITHWIIAFIHYLTDSSKSHLPKIKTHLQSLPWTLLHLLHPRGSVAITSSFSPTIWPTHSKPIFANWKNWKKSSSFDKKASPGFDCIWCILATF